MTVGVEWQKLGLLPRTLIYTEYSILLKQLAVRLGSERSKITGLFA